MKTRNLLYRMVITMVSCVLNVSLAWAAVDPSDTLYGTGAGTSLTTGTNDTFIGYDAGFLTTGAGGNTFVGYNAGYHNTGPRNTFMGGGAGGLNTTGTDNTFLGREAGNTYSTGIQNTFIGSDAGLGQSGFSNGTGNVFLGYGAGYSETGSNMLYIDNCFLTTNPINQTTPVYPACDNPFILGTFDTRLLEIDGTLIMGVTVATISDVRYKKDIHPLESSLDKLMKLQGVSYAWKTGEVKGTGYKEGRQIGLIAQEVEKVLPELVHADGKGYKAVSYDKIVPVLIEAVKEQQKEMKDKDARIEKLEKSLEIMERRMVALESPAKTIALK